MTVIASVEPQVVGGDEDTDEKWLWIGPDDRGLVLEVIGLPIENNIMLIIHVMPFEFRRNR